VHRSRALGSWLLTSHADIVRCLRDPRFSSVGRAVSVLDRIDEPCARERLKPSTTTALFGLIHSDPPEHTHIRSLVNKAFTPRRVLELRSRLQKLVDGLLDRVEHRREMDVIADLAFPLPVTVISEALGIPIADRAQFKGLVRDDQWDPRRTAHPRDRACDAGERACIARFRQRSHRNSAA
jgi:cytochrome P450